jgi:hypothetical protein
MAWRPNFRLNYWLCNVLAVVGIAGAVVAVARDDYGWFAGSAGVAVLALLIPRLLKGRVPIPGTGGELEGDFAPIGDPFAGKNLARAAGFYRERSFASSLTGNHARVGDGTAPKACRSAQSTTS